MEQLLGDELDDQQVEEVDGPEGVVPLQDLWREAVLEAEAEAAPPVLARIPRVVHAPVHREHRQVRWGPFALSSIFAAGRAQQHQVHVGWRAYCSRHTRRGTRCVKSMHATATRSLDECRVRMKAWLLAGSETDNVVVHMRVDAKHLPLRPEVELDELVQAAP